MKRLRTIESLERRHYFTTVATDTVNFSAAVQFATGLDPSDLVAMSLTGNGITDVVTSDYGSASIAVMRGNGNGTFQSPVFYGVGNSPIALAEGNLSNNGIPDIVTANEADNTISILMGNGDGTFAPQVTYAVGVRPEAVALADLTGNGLMDIITANDGSNDVSVLMNNGNGTFQPAVSHLAGSQLDGLAVADLNGDGLPDIVTADPANNEVHVLLNDRNGTFAAPIAYAVGLSPRAVAIADVTGDGRPDIITANRLDDTVAVLDGNGDGTFQDEAVFGTSQYPFSVAVADINGDGRADMITANNYDDTVSVLVRGAEGGFAENQGFKAGDGPVAAVVADVNGDGKPDIIAADFDSSTISVLLNQTTFVPLIPTTTTLAVSQNPIEVGNRLELSVQLTPSSLGSHVPHGLVQFFDGDLVLGLARPNASGLAVLYTSKLAVGPHGLSAVYAGDGLYAGSLSNGIVDTVLSPAEVSPLLSPTITGVRLSAEYVAGNHGVVDLSISNIGVGAANGVVAAQLYASLSGTFDSTAFPIAIDGNSVFKINLAGGTSRSVGLSFTVPDDLQAANYTFFAALVPVSGFTQQQVIAVPATGTTTAQSVLQFGTVGTQKGVRLIHALAGGSIATITLSGLGNGVLTDDPDGGIDLSLSGTTSASSLSIAGTGITLDGLTDTGSIGSIVAPTTTLAGVMSVPSINRLTLASVSANGSIATSRISAFIDTGDFAGEMAAGTIGSVLVSGNLNDAVILAGASFGADGRLGNNDDTFGSGTLSSIVVGGHVTNSFVAAGFDPVGDNLQTTGATLLGKSAIKAVTVVGLVDSNSRFLSASIPAKVRIDGGVIASATDPIFSLYGIVPL